MARDSTVLSATLVASVMWLASSAPRAGACLNGVEWEQSPDLRQLDTARNALRGGQLIMAMRRSAALAGRPSAARRRDPFTTRRRHPQTVAQTATILWALAVTRLDGAVDDERRRRRRNLGAEQRLEHIRWAEQLLGEAIHMQHQMARLAEAHARIPGQERAARNVFEDLLQRDLMPDAWSYRTLAQLRHRDGEADGAAEMMTMCRRRAGNSRRRVCPRTLLRE